MRVLLVVVCAVLVWVTVPVAGLTEVMTESDIARALNVANGSDATRARFHAPYRMAIDDPMIHNLEIVTEFRSFVSAAEDQVKAGNWMMARGGYDSKGRTIKDLLRPRIGQVAIRAQLQFHPHNNYTTLPAFDILLGEPTLLALNSSRTPVMMAGTDGGLSSGISGATIETFYNAPTIADRVLPLRLLFEGKEVARLSVDFSRIE